MPDPIPPLELTEGQCKHLVQLQLDTVGASQCVEHYVYSNWHDCITLNSMLMYIAGRVYSYKYKQMSGESWSHFWQGPDAKTVIAAYKRAQESTNE